MSPSERDPTSSRHVLATDLDGTLIPLQGNDRNVEDLRKLTRSLRERRIPLVFVTGRHLASVRNVIQEHELPAPDWIICDVGTTICSCQDASFSEVKDFRDHLAALTAGVSLSEVASRLSSFAGLDRQEDVKQGRFKLSYYTDANNVEQMASRIEAALRQWDAPYSVIHSIDPFNGDGLIDLLPRGASKAYALDWWTSYGSLPRATIIFAGDSGNDLAAFAAGYRTIVVGNADRAIATLVRKTHEERGWTDRLYLATEPATSGVLSGCRWFGAIP